LVCHKARILSFTSYQKTGTQIEHLLDIISTFSFAFIYILVKAKDFIVDVIPAYAGISLITKS